MIFIAKESGLMNDDEYAWSMVIHELVHWLQDMDGKMAMVEGGELRKCDVENIAYSAQRKYLESIDSKWDIDWTDGLYGDFPAACRAFQLVRW